MNIMKLINRFRAEPWYFKVVFGITIVPVLLIIWVIMYGSGAVIWGAEKDIPDSEWGLLLVPVVLVGLLLYCGVLYLCSKKSLIGLLTSMVVLAGCAYIAVWQIALYSSGGNG